MDEFAKQNTDETTTYFEQAAIQRNLSATIIEKDFWVCWTLRRLYQLEKFRDHLTFKGGTSLSKVFDVIHRFSEDIDVSISRQSLGFEGEKDPESAPSKSKQNKLLHELQQECARVIHEQLEPQLRKQIENAIGNQNQWELTFDPADKVQQTLLFKYPSKQPHDDYIAPSVKIEFGARSDNFPVEEFEITPYLHNQFPEVLSDPTVQVTALGVERTFWEKATILHMLFHQQDQKRISPRMSRHYYDLYQIFRSQFAENCISRLDLLKRVATHKNVFFSAAWAKYDEAKPGSLHLAPKQNRISELENDYQAMQPMFLIEPPSFNDIVKTISTMEERINNSSS